MTLNEFINQSWVGQNKTLLLCEQSESLSDDDLLSLLDDLNFKESEINAFKEIENNYLICAIDFKLTPTPTEMFLKEELNNKEVTVFAIYKDYLIVFV